MAAKEVVLTVRATVYDGTPESAERALIGKCFDLPYDGEMEIVDAKYVAWFGG